MEQQLAHLTEKEVAERIAAGIEDYSLDEDGLWGGPQMEDLKESMYLTNDEGLVIRFPNRQKFIVTVQEVR